MPSPDRFEVEVVFIIDHDRTRRLIVVRPLTRTVNGFTLTEEVTLGGFPVSGMELPPRALHPDGTPRRDLLCFRLRHRDDSTHLHIGQTLWLDGLHLTPHIALEVIRVVNLHHTRRHILVRHLHSPAPQFHIGDHTTLSGIPVENIGPPPLELGPDGHPRQDLLTLRLRNHQDLAYFLPGTTVFLEGYHRDLSEASLPELLSQLHEEIAFTEETAAKYPDWDWPHALLIPYRDFYQAASTVPLDPARIRATFQKLTHHITTHRLKGFHLQSYPDRLEQLAREASNNSAQ